MIASKLATKARRTIPRPGRAALRLKQGDIIRVPFPYTDRPARQHRPAPVVSKGGIGKGMACFGS